ncbi:MAG: radical SAM protein [Candidatus Thorarchaeota archaeon]
MSKIHIVNWLLTRKCNLECDYCAIVKNYKNKPKEYPDMKHYFKNEMSTDYVIDVLTLFKLHNPHAFHIFYGGEPLLRKDLPDIINYCNNNNIHYTIISNNTKNIQPLIDRLFEKTSYVQGFTSSVDPVFNSLDCPNEDRVIKSIEGFKRLVEIKKKGLIKDVVAEITAMRHNVFKLYDLVQMLSNEGINSDITFIDISKNPYYDFSNITNKNLLVSQEESLWDMALLTKSPFDIHMKKKLLPKIYEILPSNMDCKIENKLHNVTIDADGSVRLCLRIRGVTTPNNVKAHELFSSDRSISKFAHMHIIEDKKKFCELCNHTCYLMSQIIDEEESEVRGLIHKNKREEK